MQNDVYENPFCILGASAQDGAKRLIELADDAALLGESRAESALAALMHSRSRLDAEIGWFPGADGKCIQSVLDYRDAQGKFPSIEEMAPLARLNAARLLLECWPAEDEDGAYAVCMSTALAAGFPRTRDIVAQLNADRAAAGMPMIADEQDVLDRIERLYRQTAKRLDERISALGTEKARRVLDKAAASYARVRSPILAELMDIYRTSVFDEAKRLEEEITKRCGEIGTCRTYAARSAAAREIDRLLERWHTITCPVRRLQEAKGVPDEDARRIYGLVIDVSCVLNNDHNMHRECYDLTIRMLDVFFELRDAQELLKKNRDIVERVLQRR